MNGLNIREIPKRMLLTAIFLLALMCFSANSLHAQIQQEPAPTAFNWKSSTDASTILLSQINLLNQQMPGLGIGTPLYDNTLRRVAYYKSIAMEISKGATVAEAIEIAIPAAATLGFEKEASYTPKIVLKALHTETRIMLTN